MWLEHLLFGVCADATKETKVDAIGSSVTRHDSECLVLPEVFFAYHGCAGPVRTGTTFFESVLTTQRS